MEISRMLTISTAHITESTAKELENFGPPIPDWLCWLSVYTKSDYGWWIFVDDSEPTTPSDLAACLRLARRHNCEWLCLDCDGEIVDELPTYDW